MAKRYIGDAVITITYHDTAEDPRAADYRGTIQAGGHTWKFDGLHAPASGFRFAYDSPQAYDEMAVSAVGFATYYSWNNRGDDTPSWAPSADVADAIAEATQWAQDDRGKYEVRRTPKGKAASVGESESESDNEDEDKRDESWVTLYDYEALKLMPGWTGGQDDPLYAISSSGGANYAWVFQDAIANLDADIARVKKIGRNEYQLGNGTFTKKEIDELHTIRDALVMTLDDPENYSSPESEEARRRPRTGLVMESKALAAARAKLAAHGMSIQKTGHGDYRVYPRGSRNPDEGYFTDDLDDAVATGISIAQKHTTDLPQLPQHTHIVMRDFSTLPEVIEHARQEGATHVLLADRHTALYFPVAGGRYEEARVWREAGYWHAEAKNKRVLVNQLPAGAEPIVNAQMAEEISHGFRVHKFYLIDLVTGAKLDGPFDSHRKAEAALSKSKFDVYIWHPEHTGDRPPEPQAPPHTTTEASLGGHIARDYIAVDPGGRVVAGPFKDYGKAKQHADRARGHVEFKMGEAVRHTVRDPSELRYEIEKTRHGWTVVAYSPSGVRMPLTTYPTHESAVTGLPADKAAMSNPYYKTMGEAGRKKKTLSDEEIGAQYAQDQVAGEYFMDWVRNQMIEAEEMGRREPGSVFPLGTKAAYKKLARNMLQQLEWDTKREMDPHEIHNLGATDPRAFFSGFVEELKSDSTVNWLADEIETIHKQSGGPEVDEARAGSGELPEELKSVIGTLAHNRQFTIQDLEQYTQFDRPHIASRAKSMIGKMVKMGYLERTSRGHYFPTKAGWAWIDGGMNEAHRPHAPAPHMLPPGPVRHRRRPARRPVSARRRAR